MAGLCEGGNESASSLKAIFKGIELAFRYITNPSAFQVKKRDKPPECLTDPVHGTHGYFSLKIYDVSIICQPDRSRLVPVAWQQWSEMEALIPSPAACEVRSVIKFFNAQNIAPIEIHRQLCQVYGPNIMSKQMVRRWCRQFCEGRQSVHDEERSGRPSLINDDRVELVRQCIMENRRFTITELSSHFPQISRSLLHEIVTKHLLFKKVCAWWVPKNLTPEHKMQRLGAALTFLQQ
ncbi:hypothetical protein ANN_26702 [Periplaneta americana]|uniref:Mos1 transposase HTH domain-containing protein n=1 Tax=Periplaneta americana TaxID=6978 RepID=A0ABQ8RYY2_PERAM|nr:hypothetical protein ANN_26702 [Periplaneta americana]